MNIALRRLALLLPAFGALSSCSDNGLSPDRSSSHTAEFAASPTHFVVIRTEDRDDYADGSVDTRYNSTAWYDAHGNKMKEILDWDERSDGAVESRSYYVYAYNQHGVEMSFLADTDNLADGSIDVRAGSTALEVDQHGNPTRYLSTFDEEADGTIDGQSEWFTEYDARGNLLKRIDSPTAVFEFAYDAHGNLIHAGSRTYEYNAHDQLIHMFDDKRAFGSIELSTVVYDQRGNPIRQLYVAKNTAGIVEQKTISIAYDGQRNPTRVVEEQDHQGNGTIDEVVTTTFRYSGLAGYQLHPNPSAESFGPALASGHPAEGRESGISRSFR